MSKNLFDLSLVEEDKGNHSILNLKDKPNRLIPAAFKFIRLKDIRMVDFSNTGFHDENMRMLAGYLKDNPNLRSVYLDSNIFTDDGLRRVTEQLRHNTKLAHLSIRACVNVNDLGLK